MTCDTLVRRYQKWDVSWRPGWHGDFRNSGDVMCWMHFKTFLAYSTRHSYIYPFPFLGLNDVPAI